MDRHVLLHSQDSEKATRRLDSKITNVDLSLAPKDQLTSGVVEDASMKSHRACRTCNTQQTLHSNGPHGSASLDYIVGKTEAYRRMLCCAERFEEMGVLQADATVKGANRNRQCRTPNRGQTIALRSDKVFRGGFDTDVDPRSPANEAPYVRRACDPDPVWGGRRRVR
jgi:hypothetical protein